MAIHAPTTPEVRPSRRSALLSAAGFTGLAAVATVGWSCPDTRKTSVVDQSGANPDARLIALCTRFDDLERQRIRSHEEDGDDEGAEAFRKRLDDLQHPLLRQIVAMRATTLAGVQARARMLHLWDTEVEANGRPEGSFWNDAMIWALVRDLTGAA